MITVMDKFGNISTLSVNKNWKIELKDKETGFITIYDSVKELNKSHLKWREIKCQHTK